MGGGCSWQVIIVLVVVTRLGGLFGVGSVEISSSRTGILTTNTTTDDPDC